MKMLICDDKSSLQILLRFSREAVAQRVCVFVLRAFVLVGFFNNIS